MPKVLIISHAFPPNGSIGSLRVTKFAKYLPAFGWEPIILTVRNDSSMFVTATVDSDVPDSVKVFRTQTFEPLSTSNVKKTSDQMNLRPDKTGVSGKLRSILKKVYFSLYLPDLSIGWLPFAVKIALEIIKREHVDLIFATAPPQTALIVGSIVKRLTGIPLVLDYRDEWSLLRYREIDFNPFTHRLNNLFEKKVLHNSTAIVAVMPHIIDNLVRNRYLSPNTHTKLITNGYDTDDFQNIEPLKWPSKYTIVFTGALYGKTRKPDIFFKSLAMLFARRPDIRLQMQVIIVGTYFSEHMQMVEAFGLGDIVKFIGFIPHKDAVRYQISADLLLYILNNQPGSDVWLMGKLFEYIASHRPILALAPHDSASARLIMECNSGEVVNPENIYKISDTIESLFSRWCRQRDTFIPNVDIIRNYSRKQLTAQLAAFFDKILDKRRDANPIRNEKHEF